MKVNPYNDPFVEVRTVLATTTNTAGVLGSAAGGAEIQKMIERLIVRDVNVGRDIAPRIQRIPFSQMNVVWTIQSDLGSTNKAAFYSEGATGTPYPSTRIQVNVATKSYRADYEVSNMMVGAAYFDILAQEAMDALDALKLLEERSIICGTDTSAYGFANSFQGLLQLMNSFVTLGDTTTVYGLARASGRTYLDVSLVAPSTTTSAAFELKLLDTAITKSDRAGGASNSRIFFCSPERRDEINSLIFPQGRWNMNSAQVNLSAGLMVETYRNLPIVASRYMDKNGLTSTGSDFTASYADNAMYLLDMTNIAMYVLSGVDFAHVPLRFGSDASQRSDTTGGYFKTYGVLAVKRFTTQVLIYNLSAPA